MGCRNRTQETGRGKGRGKKAGRGRARDGLGVAGFGTSRGRTRRAEAGPGGWPASDDAAQDGTKLPGGRSFLRRRGRRREPAAGRRWLARPSGVEKTKTRRGPGFGNVNARREVNQTVIAGGTASATKGDGVGDAQGSVSLGPAFSRMWNPKGLSGNSGWAIPKIPPRCTTPAGGKLELIPEGVAMKNEVDAPTLEWTRKWTDEQKATHGPPQEKGGGSG